MAACNKLCLGTAQLGMNYGIKNDLGRQPTMQESFSLLQRALEEGIDSFDTAEAYGSAETILGEFGLGRFPVSIVSKISFNDEERRENSLEKLVEDKIKNSLSRMKIKYLDCCLLHDAGDFYHKEIMQGLAAAKAKNIIRTIGVSVYEVRDALAAAESGCVDCIQIPFNVLDQRLEETDFFGWTAINKIEVYARSSFLQGLLLMDLDRIPNCLSDLKPHLHKFHEIIRLYGFTRFEAAFLFSYCHPSIDKVVFGVETEQQLMGNITTIQKEKYFRECFYELKGAFVNINKRLILPNLWTVSRGEVD